VTRGKRFTNSEKQGIFTYNFGTYQHERPYVTQTATRIRGRRLQTIRSAHLRLHPLCVHCVAKGVVRLGTQVDHILALSNGGADEEGNRQTLCGPCHSDKTQVDMGRLPKMYTGPDGWPIEVSPYVGENLQRVGA